MSALSSFEAEETPEPQPVRRKLGKRSKPVVPSDEEMSDVEDRMPSKRRRLKAKAAPDESEMSLDHSDSEHQQAGIPSAKSKELQTKMEMDDGDNTDKEDTRKAADALSDSEMSEVIDEPIVKKRSRGTKTKAPAKAPAKLRAPASKNVIVIQLGII